MSVGKLLLWFFSLLILFFGTVIPLEAQVPTSPANCVPDPPDGVCSVTRPCCDYPGRSRVCDAGYCRDIPIGTPIPTATLTPPLPVRNPGATTTAPMSPTSTPRPTTPAAFSFGPWAECEGSEDNPGVRTAIGCIHTSPLGLVKDLLTFVVAIAGGLAFLLMLLGAFQILTSTGNPEALQAGRERFQNAIIGLLFVIFAVLLLQIIGADILKLPDFGR